MKRILAILMMLCCVGVGQASEQRKSVAVVYDDSGSMSWDHSVRGNCDKGELTPLNRMVFANYAVKFLVASLGDNDNLSFVYMSNKKSFSYNGRDKFNDLIQSLDSEGPKCGGTPAPSIKLAVDSLVGDAEINPERPLWLVIITDGDFNDYDENIKSYLLDKIKKYNIEVRVVKIGDIGLNIDALLSGKDKVFESGDGSGIFNSISELSGKLNGLGDGKAEFNGNTLVYRAPFPLRRALVLSDNRHEAKSADWGGKSIELKDVRRHEIKKLKDNRPKVPVVNLPDSAWVYHLRGKAALPAGSELRLTFGDGFDSSKVRIFPEVAADYSVELSDASGKKLPKLGNDYLVCDPLFKVVAHLNNSGKSLLDKRDDEDKFKFSTRLNGNHAGGAKGANKFVHDLDSLKDGERAALTTSLEYDGYLYRESQTIQLQFGGAECKRTIQLDLASGVDADNVWKAPLDSVTNTDEVKISVAITDGRAATKSEIETWAMQVGPHLEKRIEDGAIYLRPRSGCCLWWWKYPGAGEFNLALDVKTGRAYDTVVNPPNLVFRLEQPDGVWRKVLWYGCPFAALALIALLLWYFVRLLRKHRFPADARFESEERPKEDFGGVVRPRTIILREEGSALMRWLWPSRAELVTIRGLRMRAAYAGDIVVDGRDLQAKHRVPGWVYSPPHADDPKGRVQNDAAMSDNMVMTIDEGIFTVSMRYRA